ncbi:MAG: glycosyltransferase family 4 protein [Alphaproteobacteria bacterium]
MADIAVVTNAPASGQRSMLGYGALVLDAARRSGAGVTEWRGVSALSARLAGRTGPRVGKLTGDVERFGLTPLRLAGRRADIVHVVDPGNAIYLDVVRARRTVVTVHDMIPYLAAAGRLDGFRPSRAGRRLMRAILTRLGRADRVVAVSEATRRDVLALAEPAPERVVTIPNAVFQDLAPADPAACRALRCRLGLDAGARVVLHIGRNFYKNHAMVLEVFARLARHRSDLVLVFVMPRTAALDAAIRRHGLEARVRVVPYVADGDMAALYTTARLLLFPSLYEGFGYPVLEAQLCDTPVVCSNGGALADVAGDGARVFEPEDAAGMAAAAAELLDDPGAAAALVARGRANAARFDRATWFAQHEALWRDLGLTSAAEHGTQRPAA